MSLSPWIRSPFTDMSGGLFNGQSQPTSLCAKIEMKLNDCLEAYGMDLGMVKCADFLADLRECSFHQKKIERSRAMQIERYRQWKSGERKERYEQAPPLDTL